MWIRAKFVPKMLDSALSLLAGKRAAPQKVDYGYLRSNKKGRYLLRVRPRFDDW